MTELKPQGIYTCYQKEYDNLNERMQLSLHMMIDLIAQEAGNKEYNNYATHLQEFIKDCPLEVKLKMIKELDI